MRKRIRMPVKTTPTAPIPLTFTVEEVFAWVCQRQGVKHPEHLSDGRFRCLWDMAQGTAQKINVLYTHALTDRIEAVYADGLPDFSGVNAVQTLLAKETKGELT